MVVLILAAAAPAGAPGVEEVRVRGASPQALALGSDGSVWATNDYGGVTRLAPRGRIKIYAIGDNYASDLVAGPDGGIWLAAGETVMRLDSSGRRRSWPVPATGLARAITGASGALWFTNESIPDRIDRLGTDGSIHGFTIGGPRQDALMAGIAAASDGSLWFTQARFEPRRRDGIGRMTADGRSASWALPRRATPLRIAAGPDGALWFTEQDAHAIGRITSSGAVTHFPLVTGLSPYDIKPGVDGAMWFTADSCVGRIAATGQITAWPIRGAGRLLGIAAAADGSIWAADDLKSALWHFVPPGDGAAPRTPCSPPTLVRRSRSVRATLVYRRDATFGGTDWFTDGRVRIARKRKQLFAESVPSIERRYGYSVVGATSSFAVRDLDGDREPEVLLELNWNGAHCCEWARVYRYVPAHRAYRPTVHFWGDDAAAPRIRDLNGDGKPEFKSVDGRFAYAFASYAGSWFPVQVWAYRHGGFSDVTRSFPTVVRLDASRVWRFYLRHRRAKGETVRGLLPAWAADEYLLGRGATVWPTLEREARAGYLDCPRGTCAFTPRNPRVYLRRLRAFLRQNGYVR